MTKALPWARAECVLRANGQHGRDPSEERVIRELCWRVWQGDPEYQAQEFTRRPMGASEGSRRP